VPPEGYFAASKPSSTSTTCFSLPTKSSPGSVGSGRCSARSHLGFDRLDDVAKGITSAMRRYRCIVSEKICAYSWNPPATGVVAWLHLQFSPDLGSRRTCQLDLLEEEGLVGRTERWEYLRAQLRVSSKSTLGRRHPWDRLLAA